MIQLVVNNEWVVIGETASSEILHREYHPNTHGLVFIDENNDGNSVLMDSHDNIIDIFVSDSTDFDFLKQKNVELYEKALTACSM